MKGRLMIELKILGAESFPEIMAFDKLCFPTDCWKEEDMKGLLEEDRAIYYALMDQGKLVGDAFIYNWKGEHDYVKLMNLAVHPDYRGQGLAHKLLNHVTEEMVKDEMYRFCGETRSTNYGMQKVFEDCGYKLNRVEENYFDNPPESAYKYVLQIEDSQA